MTSNLPNPAVACETRGGLEPPFPLANLNPSCIPALRVLGKALPRPGASHYNAALSESALNFFTVTGVPEEVAGRRITTFVGPDELPITLSEGGIRNIGTSVPHLKKD